MKQGKYGITLENPELEVLDDSEGAIESMKVWPPDTSLSADGGGGCWFGEAIDFGRNAGGENVARIATRGFARSLRFNGFSRCRD